jgi:glucose/mannose-6-phosphate isomerase
VLQNGRRLCEARRQKNKFEEGNRMNLDNIEHFRALDSLDMYGEIHNLPDQLRSAWELGSDLTLPDARGLQRIVIAGMGGSAIGADLVASYVEPNCKIPLVLVRDYKLPVWASGPETLVIASSHSGNTEETLEAFAQARQNGCRLLVLSTGGKLAESAREVNAPVWQFEHKGQPRAAVGFSFGLLLAVVHRLGFIEDPSTEIASAVAAMQEQQAYLAAESPVERNPAKRMAGQLYGRWITVMASDYLNPVARRWKGQMSEIAKAWAQFEFLPEADHNTLAGIENPEEILSKMMILFLQAPSNHPRNRLRLELTRKTFMAEGLATDFVNAKGDNPLAHIWTSLHFGDYSAFYLAMAYEVDPTPIEALLHFKAAMKER